MIAVATREMVVSAARALVGRTDINFASRSPAEGLVCIDIFVLACEGAGIPFRELMRRLYRQNPQAYPADSGPPMDVNFHRRIRNVIAFLTGLGLWYPSGRGLPGQLVALADGPGEPAHTGVVSEASGARVSGAVMATSFGGPLAVREVGFASYLAAHPEFTVAGFGDPPLGSV